MYDKRVMADENKKRLEVFYDGTCHKGSGQGESRGSHQAGILATVVKPSNRTWVDRNIPVI
jgi:hypothetical protein